ncbi:MAG: hypothetical protein ACON47_01650, partial [Flavobacteriaceae bacterium]
MSSTASCDNYSLNYTITTSSQPALTFTSNQTSHTICSGDTIQFSATGTGNWYEYLRYSGSVTSSLVSQVGGVYSTSSLVDGDIITVKSYSSSTTTSCFASESITVRVNSFDATANVIAGDETLCSGEIPALLGDSSSPNPTIGVATKTFQWQFDSGSGWTDIASANSSTYTFSTSLTTTTEYRRKVIIEFNGKSCESLSNVVTKTVNQTPSITNFSITTPNINNTICDNEDVELNVTATNIASPEYRLYRGATLLQGPFSGTTTYSFTVSGTDVSNGDILSVTVNNTTGGGTCSDTSMLTIYINEFDFSTASNTITGSQSICFSLAPNQLSDVDSPTATGSVTISWESRISGTTSWSSIPSANSINYTPTSVVSTTEYRRILTSDLNGKLCESYSNVVTITVISSSVSLVLRDSGGATALDNNLICDGDTIVLDASGSTNVASYQFYQNTTALTGITATPSWTVSGATINHNDRFWVVVYLNSGGTGC